MFLKQNQQQKMTTKKCISSFLMPTFPKEQQKSTSRQKNLMQSKVFISTLTITMLIFFMSSDVTSAIPAYSSSGVSQPTYLFAPIGLSSLVAIGNPHERQGSPLINRQRRSLASGRWGLRPGKRSFENSINDLNENSDPSTDSFYYILPTN